MLESISAPLTNLLIILLLFSPFLLRSALNIRAARREHSGTSPLDWKRDTTRSFKILWNAVLIVVLSSLILVFFFRALAQ